jgi:predicted XRE-type DNA-binding protein
MIMTKGSGNVFADLGFDVEEAQNLQLRSQTMMAVEAWYRCSGLTQAKASKELGITQPRFNQLLKGKIEDFSLDALVNMATRAGMHVGLTIKPAPRVKLVKAGSTKTVAKSLVSRKTGQARRAA